MFSVDINVFVKHVLVKNISIIVSKNTNLARLRKLKLYAKAKIKRRK